MIGFMGVDPTDIHEAMNDLAQAREDSAIHGITVAHFYESYREKLKLEWTQAG